jgi:hypothetical protein
MNERYIGGKHSDLAFRVDNSTKFAPSGTSRASGNVVGDDQATDSQSEIGSDEKAAVRSTAINFTKNIKINKYR